MGEILQSCECNIDCCDKNKKILENNDQEDSDEYESEEYDDQQEFMGIVKKSTKTNYSLPSDVINMIVRAKTVIQHNADPWSIYEELEEIGCGAYGVVKKVCLKNNRDIIRAIKIIPKERLVQGFDDEKLSNEILILKNLDHPNIMKIYEFFEDEKNYYMVTEYYDQNDLYHNINKVYCMNPIVVKLIMEQLFNAVAYLHSKGVFHGDIKLENIMLYSTTKYRKQRFSMINRSLNSNIELQDEINNSFIKNKYSKTSLNLVNDMLNYEIKLIDFGCSKIFTKKGEKKSGIIGTSIYCSPEVIDNLYDEKCDEWSCGVLMYILLSGEAPFTGNTEEEIFEKIKKCDYNFHAEPFKYVSENCIDLIKKLLEPNKHKRIKAIDALKHPFFTEAFNPDKALTQNKDLSLIEKLSEIKRPYSKFHEAVISYMCSNYLSKEEEKKLRAVFRYIDYDRKNYLTKDNLEKRLKENGKLFTEEKIKNILNAFDFDENGSVEYQELLIGLCDKNLLLSKYNLQRFFDIIDKNKKGYLNSSDIKNFAFQNKIINEEALTEYLKQFGMKMNDKLYFDNFVYIIKNNCSLEPNDNNNEMKKDLTNEYHNNLDIYEYNTEDK